MQYIYSFLGHGDSIETNAKFFRIGLSTMYKIVPEVAKVICDSLKKKISFPNRDEWKAIADRMYKVHSMPNCMGALDGKHFRLKNPPKSASAFHNYKHFKSILLLGICDAYRRFIWVNIGDFVSTYYECFNIKYL